MRTKIGLTLLVVNLVAGCDRQEKIYPDKAPLPVITMTLAETTPVAKRLYSGSVRSWKSEDLTFEVSGRVAWVLEPSSSVEGRSFRMDGTPLSKGTQIAQLEEDSFRNALDAAKSKVRIETLRRDGLQIQLESSIPAEIASAQSQLELAETELNRNKRLVQQNAGVGKNLDKAQADYNSAKAKIDELDAKRLQLGAEIQSAAAAIEQAKQSEKDALRDLENTRLYSAFPGQIAAVQVVPGSLAGPNSTVATVQMINPIKVEVEVSADVSRKLVPGDRPMLGLVTGDAIYEQVEATVYSIAPSADNATRTFTLTLLVVNIPLKQPTPAGMSGSVVATTANLWRLGLGILPQVPDGTYYMPVKGIYADGKGSYVWRVTNFGSSDPVEPICKVTKLYVLPGDVRVPLLGKTDFQTVEIAPGQDFAPQTDMFTMELMVDGQPVTDWEGDSVRLNIGERWLLRPGDLVQVDLAREPEPSGVYVPVSAVNEEAGKTFLFTVKDGIASKVQVNVANVVGQSQHRVKPADSSLDLVGQSIVVEGVHYLLDGQAVNVVSSRDSSPAEVAP